MIRTLTACFVALSLSATASFAEDAEFHPSTYTTYKQHNAYDGSVEVLSTLPKEERSYTEIGMVRVSTERVESYYEALDALKETAAKHGGTAIILEEDTKLFAAGGTTPSGTQPRNASAIAVIRH